LLPASAAWQHETMFGLAVWIRRLQRCAGCAGRGWPFCAACRLASGVTASGPWRQELGQVPLAFVAFDDAGDGTTPLAAALRRFKDRGDRHAGRAIAALFATNAGAMLADVDAVVPVPATTERLRQRGFSPPLWLAERLCSTSTAILIADGMRRDSSRPPQRGLGGAERRRNAHGAFSRGRSAVAGFRVAVVDDVTTTGATLLDAARCLREAGAEPVLLLAAVTADRERIRRCRTRIANAGKNATGAT
jgi:ComF family protein